MITTRDALKNIAYKLEQVDLRLEILQNNPELFNTSTLCDMRSELEDCQHIIAETKEFS